MEVKSGVPNQTVLVTLSKNILVTGTVFNDIDNIDTGVTVAIVAYAYDDSNHPNQILSSHISNVASSRRHSFNVMLAAQ